MFFNFKVEIVFGMLFFIELVGYENLRFLILYFIDLLFREEVCLIKCGKFSNLVFIECLLKFMNWILKYRFISKWMLFMVFLIGKFNEEFLFNSNKNCKNFWVFLGKCCKKMVLRDCLIFFIVIEVFV